MPETLTERAAAVTGVLVALALVLAALSSRNERTAVPVAAASAPSSGAAREAAPTEAPAALPVASRPVAERASRPAASLLVLAAARGDCWVSVRVGSSTGKVLYEGVLASGRTVRVSGRRLWVRLGAASNLDLTLNGRKAAALPGGTVDLVVTPAGVAPAV